MAAAGEKMGLASAAARAIASFDAELLTPDGRIRPSQPLLPLEGESIGAEIEAEPDGAIRRGPGRPPGARNRSTEELLEAFGRQYRHPLFVLGAIWSRTVDVLSRELGCSKLEAFTLQQRAAEAALPYTTKRMPQALEIDQPAMTVFLGGLAAGGTGDGENRDPLEARLAELANLARKQVEQNQWLGAGVTDATDNGATDDQAQAPEPAAQSPSQPADRTSAALGRNVAELAADAFGRSIDVAIADAAFGAAPPAPAPRGGPPPAAPSPSSTGGPRSIFTSGENPASPDPLHAESGEKNRGENSPASDAPGRGASGGADEGGDDGLA